MTTLSPLTVKDMIGFQPSLGYKSTQPPSSMFQPGLLFPGLEPYPGAQLELEEGAEVGHGVREEAREQEVKVDIPNPFGELGEIDFAAALNAAPECDDLNLQFSVHQQNMEHNLENRKILSQNDFAAALHRVTMGGNDLSEFVEHKPTIGTDLGPRKVEPFQPLQLKCTLCDNSQQFVYLNKSSLSKHLKIQHNLQNQQIVKYYLGKLDLSTLPYILFVLTSPVS